MDVTEFWALIDGARAEITVTADGYAIGDDAGDEMAEALENRLSALTPAEIVDFAVEFDRLRELAYRWDLWAAAYLIMGGCSDDSFIDFRAGLIALGRATFESVLDDPDSLAAHAEVRAIATGDLPEDVLSMEEVNYAAEQAYERVAGQEGVFADEVAAREGERGPVAPDPAGEEWDFDNDDQMRVRLPRLAAIFLNESDG
jgi:hypothetical protein